MSGLQWFRFAETDAPESKRRRRLDGLDYRETTCVKPAGLAPAHRAAKTGSTNDEAADPAG